MTHTRPTGRCAPATRTRQISQQAAKLATPSTDSRQPGASMPRRRACRALHRPTAANATGAAATNHRLAASCPSTLTGASMTVTAPKMSSGGHSPTGRPPTLRRSAAWASISLAWTAPITPELGNSPNETPLQMKVYGLRSCRAKQPGHECAIRVDLRGHLDHHLVRDGRHGAVLARRRHPARRHRFHRRLRVPAAGLRPPQTSRLAPALSESRGATGKRRDGSGCDHMPVAEFVVRPGRTSDGRAMAKLFAAVAAEHDGIATEPPVDIDQRAEQFARSADA